METRTSLCNSSPWTSFTHQMSKIGNCVSGWINGESITRSSDFSSLGITPDSTSTFNMLGLNFTYGNVSITRTPEIPSYSEPFYSYGCKPDVRQYCNTEALFNNHTDIINCATDIVLNQFYPNMVGVQSAEVQKSDLNPDAPPWWPPYMDTLEVFSSNCEKSSIFRDECIDSGKVALPEPTTSAHISCLNCSPECTMQGDSTDVSETTSDTMAKSYAAVVRSSAENSPKKSPTE